MRCFVLDDNNRPTPASCTEWTEWRSERSLWLIASDTVNGTQVTTGFLGLDARPDSTRPPTLFETLVVPPVGKPELEKYPNWDDAMQGHREIVAELEAEP